MGLRRSREGQSNPQGTKYLRILSSTVGSEPLGKFSTLPDSSTSYEHTDSSHHDPICLVLNMELLQFYYSGGSSVSRLERRILTLGLKPTEMYPPSSAVGVN